MKVEERLRELLLPVFGLDTVEEVKPVDSLINDLGADSLDFVEIIQLIERHFGVEFKTDEFIVGGVEMSADDLFSDGRLTPGGAAMLQGRFAGGSSDVKEGTTKAELFALLTVRDMANIIRTKIENGGDGAEG